MERKWKGWLFAFLSTTKNDGRYLKGSRKEDDQDMSGRETLHEAAPHRNTGPATLGAAITADAAFCVAVIINAADSASMANVQRRQEQRSAKKRKYRQISDVICIDPISSSNRSPTCWKDCLRSTLSGCAGCCSLHAGWTLPLPFPAPLLTK